MHTLIDSTKPKDGGGTRVECVPDFMREHNIEAQAVVVFTDGYVYAGWGKWDCPVLWTVLDNKQCRRIAFQEAAATVNHGIAAPRP